MSAHASITSARKDDRRSDADAGADAEAEAIVARATYRPLSPPPTLVLLAMLAEQVAAVVEA